MQVDKQNFRFAVILLLYKHVNEDITKLNLKTEMFQKALKVIEVLDKVDEVISKSLVGYHISRLHKLDLSIIRYATYEMIYDKLSPKIVINEAIEITKKYCDLDDGKQHAFTNALLDKIKENINAK